MNNNKTDVKNKTKKPKRWLIIILVITLGYTIYYNIKLSKARSLYEFDFFWESSQECQFLIPFFNSEVEKYKVAGEVGFFYSMYKNFNHKKTSVDGIEDDLTQLIFGLSMCKKRLDDTSNNVETVKHIENVYYKALKEEFYIYKDVADEMAEQPSEEIRRQCKICAEQIYKYKVYGYGY